MQQGTTEWFMARLGKVTASRVSDIIARTKSGYSTSRQNYLAQLVVERMTQKPTETFTNAAMQWGTDTEPLARAAYEIAFDLMVTEVGFVDHPNIAMAGASPDGLVKDDGLIEIKCPNTATHIETLLNDTIKSEYKTQMQWQMACTGREWTHFVSFDPRMPEKHQMKIIYVGRDDAIIKSLEDEVIEFLQEVNKTVRRIEAL
jgi:putative phage-type endonuclease